MKRLALILCLFFPTLSARSATLYYYTYSAFECGSNSGFRHGYVYLYSIRDATDCWLYRQTASSSGVDISTGAVYPSLGMVDGQPFAPGIVDDIGPGFGDAYFMLKSNYPMIWELGSDIFGNTCGSGKQDVDRDTFIISDNATFRGTRFFTHLDYDQACSLPAVAGDMVIMHNPNAAPATVTFSRWTGVAGNYTPLITQVIDPNSAWETGGTMPWEIAGAEGTGPGEATHYRITSDIDIEVSRGNFFDSDNDNAWTCVPAWDTGLKVGTEFYGLTGSYGPEMPIAVNDASGAANSFQLYYYQPLGAATVNYIIGPNASGNWLPTGGVNPVAANGITLFNPAVGQTLFKVVCAKPAQVQLGFRIASSNGASNADWFTGLTGDNGPLNTLFRFCSGDRNWTTVICPKVGTSVTYSRNLDACAGIYGEGSSLAAGGPLLLPAASSSSTQVSTVPNEALSWRNWGCAGIVQSQTQFKVTATKPIYVFNGQIGGEKYYSAPVPLVIFSQLRMVKSVSLATANPNDTLTYTMTYSNTGTGTLSFVNIWDSIPVNTTLVPGSAVSVPPADATTYPGNMVNWYYNQIMPGASGSVKFAVVINANAPIGSYASNTMSAQDDGTFMPAAGKSNLVKTLITPPVVSVAKYNNPPGVVLVGNPITYSLSYSNTGVNTATNVFICDTIPLNTTIVVGSETSAPAFPYTLTGNLLCWNIGTLQSQFTNTTVGIVPNASVASTSLTAGTAANFTTCGDYQVVSTSATTANGYDVATFTPYSFPVGAVITSVVIGAKFYSSNYHHSLGFAFTTDGTNPVSPQLTNPPSSNSWPGSTESWDITGARAWTPALVNAIRVQASLIYLGGGGDNGKIDCVYLSVSYTLPSGLVYSGNLSFQVIPNQCSVNITNTASEREDQSNGSFSNTVYNSIPGCTPSNTPSNTPSFTRTPTPSPTPSWTPTASPTPTYTYTATRTATPTPTYTATPSPTYTATPTPSGTPTDTPTSTVSRTYTPTPTPTPTPSATQTRTDTPTPTPTPTASETRTWTLTHTPTMSNTPTPSASFTYTATLTSTPSLSFTPTPSPSFTYTATLTRSPTQTSTDSPTQTVTITVTPTYTDTPMFSATPSSTDTVTLTDSPTYSPSPTETPSRTATLTRTPTPSPSPTRTVTPTFSASPTASPSPIPMPFKMKVTVYNSAGEQVALLYEGSATRLPDSPELDATTVLPGYSGVDLIFRGNRLSDGSDRIAWNGSSDTGALVTGGTYIFHVEVEDRFGVITSYNASVAVLEAAGSNEIKIFNSAGELVYHEAFRSLTESATDLSLDSSSFAPENGKLGATLRSNQGSQAAWSWDGRGSNGELVSPGSYTIQLVSSVPGGGSKTVIRQLQVLSGPDASGADPKLISLPGYLSLRFDPSAMRSAPRVGLYNLAGELVGRASAIASSSGEIRIDLSGLSSGVYVIVLEYETISGTHKRQILKAAVIR